VGSKGYTIGNKTKLPGQPPENPQRINTATDGGGFKQQ